MPQPYAARHAGRQAGVRLSPGAPQFVGIVTTALPAPAVGAMSCTALPVHFTLVNTESATVTSGDCIWIAAAGATFSTER